MDLFEGFPVREELVKRAKKENEINSNVFDQGGITIGARISNSLEGNGVNMTMVI